MLFNDYFVDEKQQDLTIAVGEPFDTSAALNISMFTVCAFLSGSMGRGKICVYLTCCSCNVR